MNPLKKLASQTAIYGIPGIAGRFLNYLLTYLYTRVFSLDQFGVNSEFYAYSGFFIVLLAFGMETGYFRFSKDAENPKSVYTTTLNFIIGTSTIFLLLIYVFGQHIADVLKYPDHVEYIYWFGWILALDAICSIPFAKLRAENKALQFAGIKVVEIGVNIAFNIFFLIICRSAYQNHAGNWLAELYNPAIGVGYVFIANLIASGVKMVLLLPQIKEGFKDFDKELLGKIVRYSLPMVVIGFAGIINEMLDRMILKYTLPYDDITNLQMLGIYGACYKLSILMSLFIQAFRFAAEPFFFAQSTKDNSRKIYADVMHYFTLFCVFIFLLVMLYMDWFQYFIGAPFRVGLGVVPILLMANLFLGIYVNLSIWYKLTDRTMLGAAVSIGGAVLTIILNILLIPSMGYFGSAWATLACYIGMAGVSYILGQKYYPVPYNTAKLFTYIAVGLGLWQLFEWLHASIMPSVPFWAISSAIMLVFFATVWAIDGRKLLKRG